LTVVSIDFLGITTTLVVIVIILAYVKRAYGSRAKHW